MHAAQAALHCGAGGCQCAQRAPSEIFDILRARTRANTHALHTPRHVLSASSLSAAPFFCMSSAVLRSARVALRKRLGQHLLVRGDTLSALVEASGVCASDTVLEIGPGTGNLTALLLPRARAVFAVELDGRLAAAVAARAAAAGHAAKFFCVQGCALRVPLPAYDRLVANIPYQISSPVLARLWAARPPPRSATLLLQAEFAARLVAKPGTADYSRLSVNCALLSESARVVLKVGREQFVPPPRVDSAVVHLVPRAGGAPAGLDFARWDTFLRVAFGGKNKRLRSVLVNKHVLGMLLANSKARNGGGADADDGGGADDADDGGARDDVDVAEDGAGDDGGAQQNGGGGDGDDDGGGGGDGSVDDAIPSMGAPRAAPSPHDVLATQHGRFSRAELHGARDSVDGLLLGLAAADWRANGMTVDQFRAVFSALEAAGWRFTPARQRVFPALPVPGGGAGADGAVR